MNTPIINPIWFYLINIFENFGVTFLACGIVALIVSIVIIVVNLACEKEKIIPKIITKMIILGSILVTIGNFIPTKDTCYKIMIASYVTPTNIELTKGEAVDLIDYLVEKIDKLNDTEESE